jgi:hypothetical protein
MVSRSAAGVFAASCAAQQLEAAIAAAIAKQRWAATSGWDLAGLALDTLGALCDVGWADCIVFSAYEIDKYYDFLNYKSKIALFI